MSCIAGSFFFYKKLPELKRIVRPVYIRMGLIPEVVTGIHTASEPAVESVHLPASQSVIGEKRST
jgi:hypothetical protein